MVELGILDYAQINEGSSPKQALAETLALANIVKLTASSDFG